VPRLSPARLGCRLFASSVGRNATIGRPTVPSRTICKQTSHPTRRTFPQWPPTQLPPVCSPALLLAAHGGVHATPRDGRQDRSVRPPLSVSHRTRSNSFSSRCQSRTPDLRPYVQILAGVDADHHIACPLPEHTSMPVSTTPFRRHSILVQGSSCGVVRHVLNADSPTDESPPVAPRRAFSPGPEHALCRSTARKAQRLGWPVKPAYVLLFRPG
jgi:hypothetical protein